MDGIFFEGSRGGQEFTPSSSDLFSWGNGALPARSSYEAQLPNLFRLAMLVKREIAELRRAA
jgi:hypothetical protein